MKNESNNGKSQGAIPTICAFALGLILLTSLPAGAVTPTVLSTDCTPPANAVVWSRPAVTGGVGSNGIGYVFTKAFWVSAIPVDRTCLNSDWSKWQNNQKIMIDWTAYWWNAGQNRWDWVKLDATRVAWVNFSVPNYYSTVTQHSVQISRNYTYAFSVRIAWIMNGEQMAAATYWFDQYGDVACEPGWFQCTLLYPPYGVSAPIYAPHRSIQALQIY